MSILSTWLHKAAEFFTTALNNAPAEQHETLAAAASQATTAAQAVEAALPTLAKVVADAALAQVPGMGAYVPALNNFLDILAAEILSRKSKGG